MMKKKSDSAKDGHAHGPAIGSAAVQHKRPLIIAFCLTGGFMVAEIIGGIVSGSLALLSDAAHMATDVIGIGLALSAIQLASRPKAGQRTYGTYRLEVLAAIINAFLLFGVGFYVLYQAYRRFNEPPEILGIPMLIVAILGLLVNIISFRLLSAGSKQSLNIRGASLEVLSDLLGSVGVIVAAVIIMTTGWPYADPIIAAAIGLFVFPRTYKLLKQALRIIMEVAPDGIDVAKAEKELLAVKGVRDVHDLHIWTITSGIEAATVHILIDKAADWQTVLNQSQAILTDKYAVTHPTIQIEPYNHAEASAAI